MPEFVRSVRQFLTIEQKDTAPINRYDGSAATARCTDRRGTSKEDFPDIDLKSESGADPLAIYRPIGEKAVSAAKAMSGVSRLRRIAYCTLEAIRPHDRLVRFGTFERSSSGSLFRG